MADRENLFRLPSLYSIGDHALSLTAAESDGSDASFTAYTGSSEALKYCCWRPAQLAASNCPEAEECFIVTIWNNIHRTEAWELKQVCGLLPHSCYDAACTCTWKRSRRAETAARNAACGCDFVQTKNDEQAQGGAGISSNMLLRLWAIKTSVSSVHRLEIEQHLQRI
jgi:hypothetical protein